MMFHTYIHATMIVINDFWIDNKRNVLQAELEQKQQKSYKLDD